jgi:hypothetical protein
MPPELEPPDSMADDIRSAMEETESEAPEQEAASEPPAREEPKDEQQPAKEESATPVKEGRDASGRFAPKTAPQTAAPAAGTPPSTAAPAPAPAGLRAPASWKPEAREVWGKLDPLAQAEVHRREHEISETLRTTAEVRHFANEMNQALAPFAQNIQSSGSTPAQAVQSLLQTESTLRHGTTRAKAELMARLINSYGIDIETLDTVLSGQQPAPGQPRDSNLEGIIEQRMRPVMEFMTNLQSREQQRQQAMLSSVEQETMAFMNDPANEFINDVKDDVADILDMAANRGQKLTLQDAYKRAIMLHPSISAIVGKRVQGNAGQHETEAAKRARQAAASIPSDGAPGRASEEGDPDDVRSAVLAAVQQVSRRR